MGCKLVSIVSTSIRDDFLGPLNLILLSISSAYALNPGRDFGARLLLSFAGYGKEVYTYRK